MDITKRPSKDEYYLSIAEEVASRSTCYRTRQGSLIVKDDQIISTGYVGAPRLTKDCFERGNCLRNILNVPAGERYELCRSVHAEQNAIINAARAGVNLFGATLYHYSCRLDSEGNVIKQSALPCFICKKMLINAGIKFYIGYDSTGIKHVYDVEKWAQDWQEKDMVDDEIKYGEIKK
ncbi:MAG: dCMP deaminase family protein [Candidatus Gracilibacteria bacterium]|nr:dCMP deaminase family protein [Candidatus Gracilibacteria bacterium]MDD2908273.1 dCMP deaminase family protein [Candidatus Gracilibacteria bacterium]